MSLCCGVKSLSSILKRHITGVDITRLPGLYVLWLICSLRLSCAVVCVLACGVFPCVCVCVICVSIDARYGCCGRVRVRVYV